MKDLKRVKYTATNLSNNCTYEIDCWEGTTLDTVWNSQKSWYTAGATVQITDNHGHSKTFTKGMI